MNRRRTTGAPETLAAPVRPEPGITLGEAGESDLEAMAELLGELFTLESDFVAARDKQLRALRQILTTPQIGRLFALRVDGELCAMANALITVSTAEGGPVLLLEDVIVKAGWRRRGYGRLLVDHVFAWGRQAGMTRVTLLADHSNASALAFYARLGLTRSAMVVLRRGL